MLRVVQTLMIGLVVGCTAAPVAGPPPADPGYLGQAPTGRQVIEVQQYCTAVAVQQCPGYTHYCESFQRGYIKNCMILRNVPADQVFVLMTR